MRNMGNAIAVPMVLLLFTCTLSAQPQNGTAPTPQGLIQNANELMEQGKPCDALIQYRKLLAAEPSQDSLYNGGLAAFMCGEYKTAAELWQKLKKQAPDDWQARAKLVQAYQALGDLPARDAEREALFEMRKSGASQQLKQLEYYCREQALISGRKVMVFENFELKGDRAVRYNFVVLDDAGKQEYEISLGSYDGTNAVWKMSNKEKAEKGERLFHLDGYYRWGHATYGFYNPEPAYDTVRQAVVEIVSNKAKPVSMSRVPEVTQ